MLILPNSSFEDPEARKTKDAIELFSLLGNRFNISHVAQVSSFPFPNIIDTIQFPSQVSDSCSKVDNRDDESYGDFSGGLPRC